MELNLGAATETAPGGTAGAADPSPRPPRSAPSPTELAPLFPQLEILELLGRGGMGAVYKARQPKLDRMVALKILFPRTGGEAGPGFAERFAREARALARLHHPEIVAVHDYGEAGEYPYLLMEYVDGVTLRQLLQSGKLAPEQALAIVPKICEALQFAHERGVVHRDIKPENILIDRTGRVKIADFGIAKMAAAGAQDRTLTGGKDVVGTPHYMAPEQVEQPSRVDHRADIFSLGVVFYEMLTGELPLGRFPPPSVRMGGVQVDVRLDEVVLHALEKAPERRYQHASEVKTAVESITNSPGPAKEPPIAGVQAMKVLKTDFLGTGAAVQAVGLALLFTGPIGLLVGIVLLVIGGRMAQKVVCTRCGNRTPRESRLCASCGADFVPPDRVMPTGSARARLYWAIGYSVVALCFLAAYAVPVLLDRGARGPLHILYILGAGAFAIAAVEQWWRAHRLGRWQRPGPGHGAPDGRMAPLKWRDAWPWDTGWIGVYLFVPSLVATAAVPFLWGRFGPNALWAYSVELLGLAFALVYAWVGARVRALREKHASEGGIFAEAIILKRPFQSPGLSILHDDRLDLFPIAGSPFSIRLQDILACRQVRWFNGSWLWFKRGLLFDLADGRRVGLAVPAAVAKSWSSQLRCTASFGPKNVA